MQGEKVSQRLPPKEEAKRALRELLKPGSEVVITSATGSARLPSNVVDVLQRALSHMANGAAVVVLPLHAELTTQQAADVLNVSRPYLVKLLESGEIPFRMVGRHRRVALSDVLAYKQQLDSEGDEAVAELTRLAQEHDLGY